MTILVTGGAGFIGSNFVLDWLADPAAEPLVNLDALTYAGNQANLASLQGDARHVFVKGDIVDRALLDRVRVRALKEMEPVLEAASALEDIAPTYLGRVASFDEFALAREKAGH